MKKERKKGKKKKQDTTEREREPGIKENVPKPISPLKTKLL
jgi:hypothetical protein